MILQQPRRLFTVLRQELCPEQEASDGQDIPRGARISESRRCTVPFQDCQSVAVIPLHKDLLQALQQKTFLKTKDQGQAPENSGNSHLLLVVAEPRDLPKVLNEKAMPRRKTNDRQAISRRVVDSDNDYRALPWQSHQLLVVVQRRRHRLLPEREISPKRRKNVNHGVIEHQPCCLLMWMDIWILQDTGEYTIL